MALRVRRFWFTYFCVRVLYLLFDVYVYGRITTLGDTDNYLSAGISFSWNIFLERTSLTKFVGGLLGTVFGGNNIFSNFLPMLFSFRCIRWAVQSLNLQLKFNSKLLFAALSMPQLCIWTSIYSKECFCLYFSAVLGVLFVNFLNNNFSLHWRDLVAFYLCILFKAQYAPFILQGLIYILLVRKLRIKPYGQIILGVMFILLDVALLLVYQPIIDEMSYMAYSLFDYKSANSTRDNIFFASGDLYRHAPLGMIVAFMGPTPAEMAASLSHLAAGLESILVVILFVYLCRTPIQRFLTGHFKPCRFFAIFLVFTGICFVHYPVGVFNPGAAIRYRTDFIFLFFLILSSLQSDNINYEVQKNTV